MDEPTGPMKASQQTLFNSIAKKYSLHYGDKWSRKYRWAFVNDVMLMGIPLEGRRVADALCGSGETTDYLLVRNALVTGFDISNKELAEYHRQWPNCCACCASIFSAGMKDGSFDAVVMVGGLHHLGLDGEKAIGEVYRLLKPGGYFGFMDPHQGSIADVFRRLWYKYDRYFGETEAAINLHSLKKKFSDRFEFLREEYGGGIAALFVLNSMILRMPLWLKPFYSWPLIQIEKTFQFLITRRTGIFCVCLWRKYPYEGIKASDEC